MQFSVVEPEGLDLNGFQILEISSRWTRTSPLLPGAIRIDPCFVEAGLDTGRYFPRYRQRRDALLSPYLGEWLTSLGLKRDVPLLLSTTGPWGPVNGGRVAWALCAAAFCDVYWLNGGSQAWTAGDRRPAAIGSPVPRQCLATLKLDGAVPVDVRSRAEWSGQRQDRYTFFRSCGHIPGALWLGDWTELVTPQRRLRDRQELRRAWERLGLTPRSGPGFLLRHGLALQSGLLRGPVAGLPSGAQLRWRCLRLGQPRSAFVWQPRGHWLTSAWVRGVWRAAIRAPTTAPNMGTTSSTRAVNATNRELTFFACAP